MTHRLIVVAVVGALLSALSSTAAGGPVTVVENVDAFQQAVGPTVFEDFSLQEPARAAILLGPLNSASSYPARDFFVELLPGTIVPGVTFSTPDPAAHPGDPVNPAFSINTGGISGYHDAFLDASGDAQRAQPITVAFDRPTSAFGFVTGQFNSGPTFDVTLRFASGPDDVRTLSNALTIGELAFFGFQSDRADIVSATFQGHAAPNGFAMDDFRFAASDGSVIPLPAPVSSGAPLLAAIVILAAASGRRHVATRDSL
jgi:hypothetical protein